MQLQAIPEAFYEPFQRRKHDQAFDAGFPLTDGDVPAREKVVVLLCYQPNGIAESTLECARRFLSAGYAPLVVSNVALPQSDIDLLEPVSWKILTRPNFGYDFGGYRDALKLLFQLEIDLHRVVILNDSVWYPVRDNDTLIEQLESSRANITGSILRRDDRSIFLESYLFSFDGPTFHDPVFRRWWTDELRITSNKYKVIRRGERGFSHAMLAQGRTLSGLYDKALFLHLLSQQSDEFLDKTVLYATHNKERFEKMRAEVMALPASSSKRQKLLEYVRTSLNAGQIYSAFPYAVIKLFDYPMLKKSVDRVSLRSRAAVLRAIDAGDLPMPKDLVLNEIRARVLEISEDEL